MSQNIDLMTPNSAQSNLGFDVSCQYTHDIYTLKWPAGQAPSIPAMPHGLWGIDPRGPFY